MEFLKYEKAEEFMKDNFELILEKEWLNCLMVGNCLEGQKIGAEGWLLAKVTENQNTELIMLYRKPWKLIMYSPTENKTEELYKFAAEEVYKLDNELLGVNAEKEIANKFAKYYCEIAKKQYKIENPLKILVLEKLLPKQHEDTAVFRKANENEKNILTNFIKEFYKDALDQETTDEEAKNKCNAYLERGYYILEKEGKIVSQAVIGRQLFTDAENPISNHIYEKIGYVKRVECEELEFYE